MNSTHITISATTYQRLGRYAESSRMQRNGQPLEDGRVMIPVTEDVHAELSRLRGKDETWDDVLCRLMNQWDQKEGRP